MTKYLKAILYLVTISRRHVGLVDVTKDLANFQTLSVSCVCMTPAFKSSCCLGLSKFPDTFDKLRMYDAIFHDKFVPNSQTLLISCVCMTLAFMIVC